MPNLPITTLGNKNISFGTIALGDDYGTIEQASLDEFMKEHEIEDGAGGIQSLLLLNPGEEYKFTAFFNASMEKPPRGTPIQFPFGGIIGNIMTTNVKWSNGEQTKWDISAKYWESMGSNPTVGTYDPNA